MNDGRSAEFTGTLRGRWNVDTLAANTLFANDTASYKARLRADTLVVTYRATYDYATASTLAYFDASKRLVTASTIAGAYTWSGIQTFQSNISALAVLTNDIVSPSASVGKWSYPANAAMQIGKGMDSGYTFDAVGNSWSNTTVRGWGVFYAGPGGAHDFQNRRNGTWTSTVRIDSTGFTLYPDYDPGSIAGSFNHARILNWANINFDGIRDLAKLAPPSGVNMYSSYDASVIALGSAKYDHMSGYQSRQNFAGTDTMSYMWGFYVQNFVTGGGHLKNSWGVRILSPSISGGSTLGDNIGMLIEDQSFGSFSRAIYTAGSAGSQFGGALGIMGTAPAEALYRTKSSPGNRAGLYVENYTSDTAWFIGQDRSLGRANILHITPFGSSGIGTVAFDAKITSTDSIVALAVRSANYNAGGVAATFGGVLNVSGLLNINLGATVNNSSNLSISSGSSNTMP